MSGIITNLCSRTFGEDQSNPEVVTTGSNPNRFEDL